MERARAAEIDASVAPSLRWATAEVMERARAAEIDAREEREQAREAARAEREKAKADDIERRKRLRCKLCFRVIFLVKRRVPSHKAQYCDEFCRFHSPKSRAKRCLHPDQIQANVRREMERRRAEAKVQVLD